MTLQQKRATIFAVTVVAVVIALRLAFPPSAAIEKEPNYYTGVSYNWRTDQWVTADGKIMPPPPGAKRGRKVQPFNRAPE